MKTDFCLKLWVNSESRYLRAFPWNSKAPKYFKLYIDFLISKYRTCRRLLISKYLAHRIKSPIPKLWLWILRILWLNFEQFFTNLSWFFNLLFLSITIWLVRKFWIYFQIWFLDFVNKINNNSHYLFRWKMKVFIQWVDVFLPFVWSQKIKKMPKKSVQDPVHHQTKLLKLMEQKEVVSEPHQVSPVESTHFYFWIPTSIHYSRHVSMEELMRLNFMPILIIQLKVSKYRKQNIKFSHPPKNQQNFVHFFALASKSGWIKKLKAF